ncbi:MAG TPA: hypothetical protein VGF67_26815 [Ktedonobacteraceae bacterium]|jgi:hypothetical protein
MDDIVPDVLQRLHGADVISMAGLTGASLGQEYCRRGYVSLMRRQGTRLSGVVVVPEAFADIREEPEESELQEEESPAATSSFQHFEVTVDVMSSAACQVVCSCGKQATVICIHAAALLNQWMRQPQSFIVFHPPPEGEVAESPPSEPQEGIAVPRSHNIQVVSASHTPSASRTSSYAAFPHRRPTVSTVSETLAQFGLSELRSVAREYGIELTGLNKQQLIEALTGMLGQPEAIRRMVGTLEKPPRQLLAAFALAGGSMSDEDLRGLFERFSLGRSGSLQDMLVSLQAKLLIVRTSFNHSLHQHFNLGLAPLDLRWYIPREVHEALHITLPITPFNVEVPSGKGSKSSLPILRLAAKDKLLANLLLIARALDGLPGGQEERRPLRNSSLLSGGRSSADGSLAIPPPADLPVPAVIDALDARLSCPPAFLRFAVRLLRQAEIVATEERGEQKLHVLPDAAHLLLGPERDEALHRLFVHWADQASSTELAELAEHGLRVRCRATPLNQPDLRRGELEQENSEARQDILALLGRVNVGEWMNFSAFARFFYRLRPTFLQRRQHLFPSPHWWIEQEEGRPLHPMQLADWLKAEGRYLANLIQGPLHWWGLCDIAVSINEQLLAFRMTPLAHALLRGQQPGEHDPAPEPFGGEGTALTVSAGGSLLAGCWPDNWPLLASIERFAEPGGVQDGKLLYELTAHSLSQAISQGHDPQELLALLRVEPEPGEAGAWPRLLQDMEQRITNYGRIRLYTDVSLLQTVDSSVMQHLTAITSLERQTLRPIQPTLLLLKKQGADRLLEELKRRGQAPLLHGEG